MESYAKGELEPPLLEETIGANFDRTVAAHRRPRGAGRGRQRPALDLGRAGPRRRRRWRSGWSAPASARATGSASGRRTAPSGRSSSSPTAKIGAVLVNINPAYRTHELAYALNQSGTRLLISATSFKTSDYRAMVEEVRAQTPVEQVLYLGTPRLGRPQRQRPGRHARGAADLVARRRRPDQHPVHVRHHGLPEGRHPQPPQHPQQRLLHDRADRLHRRGPALHPGALLPLLRHGDGQPRLHLPRRHDGDPGAGLRPRDHPAGDRGGALHRRCTACRRCSSRCRTTRRSPTTTCRRCGPGSWPARSARSR